MDAGTYHSIAVNLLEGKGYSEDGVNPSIFVAPLYPLVMFLVYKLAGVHPMLLEIIQCFLSVGIGFMTLLIGRRLFDQRTALIAAALVLFFPDLIIVTTFLYTETLFIFLFMALLYTALRVVDNPTMSNIALAGIVGGLATLTRGVTMLFPAILFFVLLIRNGLLKSLKTSVLYGLFFVLPIIPWTIRNYVTFDKAIPIAVGTGDVLWTGNYLPFDGKYNYEKTMALMDSMTVGMNQIEREAKLVAVAKENMAAEPGKTAWLMVRKFFRFWTWVYEAQPTGQRRTQSSATGLILRIAYYPILCLFIAGIALALKRWKYLLLLHLILIYYSLIHAVMLVVPRYRIPVLPLMILFAGYALVRLYDWIAARNTKKAVS